MKDVAILASFSPKGKWKWIKGGGVRQSDDPAHDTGAIGTHFYHEQPPAPPPHPLPPPPPRPPPDHDIYEHEEEEEEGGPVQNIGGAVRTVPH